MLSCCKHTHVQTLFTKFVCYFMVNNLWLVLQKESIAAPRVYVTVTYLNLHESKVASFKAAWRHPPRTRLLQDAEDATVFIMYEAHASRLEADTMMETPDIVKFTAELKVYDL